MDFQHLHLTKDVRNWNLESEGDRVKWRNCPDQMEPWKVCVSLRKSHIYLLTNIMKLLQNILNHLGLPDIFSGESVPASILRFPLRRTKTDLSSNTYSCQ